MLQIIPEELVKRKDIDELTITGIQTCGDDPGDEGHLSFRLKNWNHNLLTLDKRKQLEALKEVIDFILEVEPMTVEEHQRTVFMPRDEDGNIIEK